MSMMESSGGCPAQDRSLLEGGLDGDRAGLRGVVVLEKGRDQQKELEQH